MYCNQCGAENPDGSAFCSTCGAPLSGPSDAHSRKRGAKKEDKPLENVAVNRELLEKTAKETDGTAWAIFSLLLGLFNVATGRMTDLTIPFLLPAAGIVFGVLSVRNRKKRNILAWIGIALSLAGGIMQALAYAGIL
ncbi:MAG: zinc-ribbon domain-containing protein [Eubacteriales bacterium]|jgi:hypothetical protein|nr:zinc-ribbon domain-containing protein [Lachnospiraceae bacterium]MDD5860256.1 zinc-ribbon domain-containing protein [Eubacteriales bacterium]MCH4064881.1 zinc-ribbon domain-containing protein [Lachnospiraceae bacterium]MCH4103857.1 zinc-ribbon domain-containing protein [Lachnospiraceae bacterium]MCI1308159.1 zinc-ribbon domain-containing protein [Lachnospiraceae bacterium]